MKKLSITVLKIVDFPTLGNPMTPQVKPIFPPLKDSFISHAYLKKHFIVIKSTFYLESESSGEEHPINKKGE